jgi:hypothetical protein
MTTKISGVMKSITPCETLRAGAHLADFIERDFFIVSTLDRFNFGDDTFNGFLNVRPRRFFNTTIGIALSFKFC